jgi:hypothetical protein
LKASNDPKNASNAAILAADVVGFGRLMERDEVGTLACDGHPGPPVVLSSATGVHPTLCDFKSWIAASTSSQMR